MLETVSTIARLMFGEPLPTALDVRSEAIRRTVLRGYLAVSDLHRLGGLLASRQGRAQVTCRFYRDGQNRSLVALRVSADLQVVCQRCLDIMTVNLNSETELAAVSNDEQARQLPKRFAPLLVASGKCNLWELVEDELILDLPIVAYHETGSCQQLPDVYCGQRPEQPATGGESPFRILEQWKSERKTQELNHGSTEK